MIGQFAAAFESYINICQINGQARETTRNNLRARVNGAMREEDSFSDCLLEKLINETAINLKANKLDKTEARRIKWTTHKNLMVWFNNWKATSVELGFAEKD